MSLRNPSSARKIDVAAGALSDGSNTQSRLDDAAMRHIGSHADGLGRNAGSEFGQPIEPSGQIGPIKGRARLGSTAQVWCEVLPWSTRESLVEVLDNQAGTRISPVLALVAQLPTGCDDDQPPRNSSHEGVPRRSRPWLTARLVERSAGSTSLDTSSATGSRSFEDLDGLAAE